MCIYFSFYAKVCIYLFFVFFFQAEDGIRDLYVTGVQTCALPIRAEDAARGEAGDAVAHRRGPSLDGREGLRPEVRRAADGATHPGGAEEAARRDDPVRGRSEERRVGKECRSRWSRYK